MNRVSFSLDITPEQYLDYYRGVARSVIVTAHDGRRVSFPAVELKRFVMKEGVQGEFVLTFNNDGKLISLVRC